MIPSGPEQVTAQWLSAVLSAEDHQVDVDSVEVSAVGTGQTGATYRVAVRYGAGGQGLPQSFVVKLPAQDEAVRERTDRTAVTFASLGPGQVAAYVATGEWEGRGRQAGK